MKSPRQRVIEFAERVGADPEDFLQWECGRGTYRVRAHADNLKIVANSGIEAVLIAMEMRPDEDDLEIESWSETV